VGHDQLAAILEVWALRRATAQLHRLDRMQLKLKSRLSRKLLAVFMVNNCSAAAIATN